MCVLLLELMSASLVLNEESLPAEFFEASEERESLRLTLCLESKRDLSPKFA